MSINSRNSIKHYIQKNSSIIIILALSFLCFTLFNLNDFFGLFSSNEEDYWEHKTSPAARSHILENSCKWPIVEEPLTVLDRLLSDHKHSTCSSNWSMSASIDNDALLSFSFEDISQLSNETKCFCESKDENNSFGLVEEIDWNKSTFIKYTNILVYCKSNNSIIYENSFYNWRASLDIDLSDDITDEESEISMAVLVIPSLSLAQFKRLLPETTNFLNHNKFTTMKMFSQISETAIESLSYSFKGNNAKNVLEIGKENGCITVVNEDPSFTGKIFPNYNPDINFSEHYELQKIHNDSLCFKNGMNRFDEIFKNWRNTLHIPNTKCSISFTTLTSFSQLSKHEMSMIDAKLRYSLEQIKLTEDYERLVTVIISANDINENPNNFNEAVNIRNPVLSVRLPKSFRKRRVFDTYYFEQNANRLITNLDLYKTLGDIIMPKKRGSVQNTDSFGTSLLSEDFSLDNDCSSKGIPEHLCLCMNENTERSKELTNNTIEYQALYNIVDNALSQTECLQNSSAETDTFGPNARVYTVNNLVLKNSNNGFINNDYEFLEIGYKSQTIKRHFGSMKFKGFARVRRHISTNEHDVLSPIAVTKKPYVCLATELLSLCQLCTGKYILSS